MPSVSLPGSVSSCVLIILCCGRMLNYLWQNGGSSVKHCHTLLNSLCIFDNIPVCCLTAGKLMGLGFLFNVKLSKLTGILI